MFEISKHIISSVPCLHPEGRLDTVHSDRFENTIKDHTEHKKYLVIDFSSCSYLSSSGIRVLLRTSRDLELKGGKLVLSGLSAEILQIIQIAGLVTVFHILKNSSEAIMHIIQLRELERISFPISERNIQGTLEVLSGRQDLPLIEWKEPVLTGYDSLHIAAGYGAFGETLLRTEATRGFFFTLYHCTGLVPNDPDHFPDFRIVSDPPNGTIFVDRALSVRGEPDARIMVDSPSPVKAEDLVRQAMHHNRSVDRALCTVVSLDRNQDQPVLSVFFPLEGEDWTGGAFLLHSVREMMPGETFGQFCRSLLTWDNVEGVMIPDLKSLLIKPILWLFCREKRTDARSVMAQVITEEQESTEDYLFYLTRRLYTDSEKLELNRLHGGYSARTFRVRSFDSLGRVLRPTVLKIGDRSMISREAERCREYAMPYILNNSAMILGTSYYCQMGALRYNFVGIGGEGTELKWLTHYFNKWPASELEPLFDKIFLQILKPWYGQPVKANIHPYADHNPTKTFFPHLLKQVEESLQITPDQGSFRINGCPVNFMNPYRFLKEEYPARRHEEISYYTSICHGDLNMQNILLDKEMNVYLIDFSETGPRSVISDFARLEAIFMIESFPMESEEDFLMVLDFLINFYEKSCTLDKSPDIAWKGRLPQVMERNIALTKKMRAYAFSFARGGKTFIPYALALLEWIFPVVCYSSASVWQKRLSACIASLLCLMLGDDYV